MRIRRGNVLFILTGEIQTGKTRWLQGVLGGLSACGVPLRGVVAPGVWTRVGRGFEKLGIDNVLLPSGEVVHLARRRDLAQASGCLDACGQSESAGLGWAMADDALDRVDAHFVQLMKGDASPADVGCGDFALEPPLLPGLTVVDELGRLELLRGRGLVHALELLERGPSAAWPHAIAVVRRDLVPAARERLVGAWGNVVAVGPDDESASMVWRALLRGAAGTVAGL